MLSSQRIVKANGVDLCIETFGDSSHSAVLLIGEAAAAMDWREEEFCDRLAAGPRFVIRYDFHDTRQSSELRSRCSPVYRQRSGRGCGGFARHPRIGRRHVVGLSMGYGSPKAWLSTIPIESPHTP